MYIVTIKNGSKEIEIHGATERVTSGKIVKGINAIDSFSFTLNPANAGFDSLHDYKTQVEVYNTTKKRYEFIGRVLYTSSSMSESGALTKEVTCEGCLGYLCDSVQTYRTPRERNLREFIAEILDYHNGQVEAYKRVDIGTLRDKVDGSATLIIGTEYGETTWDVIKGLTEDYGGEIRGRKKSSSEGTGVFFDWVEQLGESKSTPIALSHNMKSISREINPTSFVTRLIPLGCKLTVEQEVLDENGEPVFDDDGNVKMETVQTEERLDISSVNGGKNYIDIEEGIEEYGIRVGTIEFDDVTTALALYMKGIEWINKVNRVKIKYRATALDLSLLGLDLHDFDIYNRHPLKNPLLNIDDEARIIKKSIDICEELKSTIEFGEEFETVSSIQNTNKRNIAFFKAVWKAAATKQELAESQKGFWAKVQEKTEEAKEEIQSYKDYMESEGKFKSTAFDENGNETESVTIEGGQLIFNSPPVVSGTTVKKPLFKIKSGGKTYGVMLQGTLQAGQDPNDFTPQNLIINKQEEDDEWMEL
jgi:phage minor structural protein